MKSILFREIKSFFGSAIGYLVVALFLLINGLFLFVIKSDYNILNSGYADLNPFFTLAPWVLLFLIPAVTMRSFSDEKKQGTLELLLTKPISMTALVLGKFFGAVLLIIIAIVPTFIYVWIVNTNGLPEGNVDIGSVVGCYFGLLFLVLGYTSIGVFASTLSENQIVAFIIAIVLCFIFYIGFQELSNVFGVSSAFIPNLGMDAHFKSMSRVVLDSRDVLYFISIATLFLMATVYKLKSEKL